MDQGNYSQFDVQTGKKTDLFKVFDDSKVCLYHNEVKIRVKS